MIVCDHLIAHDHVTVDGLIADGSVSVIDRAHMVVGAIGRDLGNVDDLHHLREGRKSGEDRNLPKKEGPDTRDRRAPLHDGIGGEGGSSPRVGAPAAVEAEAGPEAGAGVGGAGAEVGVGVGPTPLLAPTILAPTPARDRRHRRNGRGPGQGLHNVLTRYFISRYVKQNIMDSLNRIIDWI